MKKENILVIGLIALACGILAYYIYSDKSSIAANNDSSQAVSSSKIDWKNYSEGITAAKNLNKPVFLYFRSDWCTYCKKMETVTFADDKVQAELNENYISIFVDTGKEQDIAGQWGIRGVPVAWFLKADGTRISQLPGYVDEILFLKALKYISSGKYELMEFKDFN